MEKIKELKNIDFVYEKTINIPDNRFGIELEFSNTSHEAVKKELNMLFGYCDIVEYWPGKKRIIEEYDKWKIVKEGTVQKTVNDILLGGEINSPILTNTEKNWNDIKLVCNMLNRQENIKINDHCALHIHTEKTILKTLKEYINLVKLWILYEDIIYRFGYGEKDSPRYSLGLFARPYGQEPDIKEKIKTLNEIETIQELISVFPSRRFGLNISNLTKDYKPTIEKRNSNGSLNSKIIQNEIRFTLNLINYAKEKNFDEEFINYKLERYEPIFLNESIKIKPKKANELKNMIYNDEIGKLYFLKQYYKAYSDNDIEKSIHL